MRPYVRYLVDLCYLFDGGGVATEELAGTSRRRSLRPGLLRAQSC